MLEVILNQQGVKNSPLTKKEAIKVSGMWLHLFANKTKELTGKYKTGNYLWEAFGVTQTAITNAKAIEMLRQKKIEPFYVFDETGKLCYYCEADQYPNFLNSGLDVYLFPLSRKWTVVFAHDNAVYLADNHS